MSERVFRKWWQRIIPVVWKSSRWYILCQWAVRWRHHVRIYEVLLSGWVLWKAEIRERHFGRTIIWREAGVIGFSVALRRIFGECRLIVAWPHWRFFGLEFDFFGFFAWWLLFWFFVQLKLKIFFWIFVYFQEYFRVFVIGGIIIGVRVWVVQYLAVANNIIVI